MTLRSLAIVAILGLVCAPLSDPTVSLAGLLPFDQALSQEPKAQAEAPPLKGTSDEPDAAEPLADTRVWPPDPAFEHRHFKLDLTIPDMSIPAFSAIAEMTLASIGSSRTQVVLDAGPGLNFQGIRVNGVAVAFDHDKAAHRLSIQLAATALPGEPFELSMTYTADRPGGEGAGMTFSKDDPKTPEVDFMCHAQGQAQSNHLWFPCHDFPNVRTPCEVIARVPEGYQAISNGALVSVSREQARPNDNLPPLVAYHWRQDAPHVYYLVTLVVGKFDVVNVGGPDSARPGLWMPVYGPLGSSDKLRDAFADTPKIVAFFEERFATRYPWDKLAQALCRNFAAGGMENSGLITYAAEELKGQKRSAFNEFISHEIVHQWFGDMVSCASWEHLWINEGWATFGEALWAEHEIGRRAYHTAILRASGMEFARSSGRSSPKHEGMRSHRYSDPDERFESPDNVYSKGGMVLHMLRVRLGDRVLFEAAREYLARHAFDQGDTDEFRQILERVSGQSLECFFYQWVERPGHPALNIAYEWEPASKKGGRLSITIEQTQPIDAKNPAYAFELPFEILFNEPADREQATSSPVTPLGARPTQRVLVPIDSRTASWSVDLPEKPASIRVDPDISVLSRNRVTQSLADSIRQLAPDQPVYVQLQAVRNLADSSDAEAHAALRAASVDLRSSGNPWLARVIEATVNSHDRALAFRDKARTGDTP